MSSRAGTASGGRVYWIHWVPGTDTLRGICHCGAERLAEDPIELWEWLLAHPQGHQGEAAPAPGPALRLAMRG
ncbi:hypothetical protein [Micromonospora violae]|uniref:hypothetical protein n=1 Tax=Micromonospora violae TaxID=1278207 RepID=UPI0033EEDD50